MKKHLTPMDRMRLEAAREQDGKLPTVTRYNQMVKVKSENYIGIPIVPLGTKGFESIN